MHLNIQLNRVDVRILYVHYIPKYAKREVGSIIITCLNSEKTCAVTPLIDALIENEKGINIQINEASLKCLGIPQGRSMETLVEKLRAMLIDADCTVEVKDNNSRDKG